MPIVSDIGSIANLFINLTRLIIQNPLLAIVFFLMVLFFPLNIIDLILFVFINFFIAIFNLIIWIIIIPVNILIKTLSLVINVIVSLIFVPINLIIGLVGGTPVTPPTSNLPNISYFSITYLNIDLFGDQDTIIGLFIDALGWSFPLWKISKYSYI